MEKKNAPLVGRYSLVALGLVIAMLAAPSISMAEEITIRIAPTTLNLDRDSSHRRALQQRRRIHSVSERRCHQLLEG